jgi:hypothetical protein
MEVATLRKLGRDVLFQFGAAYLALRKKVSEQIETDDEIEQFIENLTTESERFQLWAANIGLQATGDRSLDYRVKDSSSVKLYTGQLLEELAEDLFDRNSHSCLWEQAVLTSFSLQAFCCAVGSHEHATVAKQCGDF